ncbi:MAG: luciferase family protein [Aeromicrobium sp.]|nr:luciferase family protein [Aeromicrobium sp.]
MKLAVYLPNTMHVAAMTQPWEPALTGRQIADVAKLAEELGYDKVFLPEHFITPASHLELSGDHYFHASTAQAFVAGATERITIGSMVTILPLHNPVIAAKEISTLDWFSGGRSLTTIGVGWMKEEFDVLGVPFHRRGRMADEYLAAMFELWHSDEPQFEGEFVSFSDMVFGPKPIEQPHPTLWIGGDADGSLRRAARFGDGWAPWLTQPGDLPARLDQLRSEPGWDDRDFSVFYSLAALNVGEAHAVQTDTGAQFGQSADEVVDQCGRLAELGVTDTWVTPPPVDDFEAYLDHLRWVAAEVMPKIA